MLASSPGIKSLWPVTAGPDLGPIGSASRLGKHNLAEHGPQSIIARQVAPGQFGGSAFENHGFVFASFGGDLEDGVCEVLIFEVLAQDVEANEARAIAVHAFSVGRDDLVGVEPVDVHFELNWSRFWEVDWVVAVCLGILAVVESGLDGEGGLGSEAFGDSVTL